MPIENVNDAVEVRAKLFHLLNANGTDRRVDAARSLFVETLDWQYADGLIPLHSAHNDNLPPDASLIANRDGTTAVYIPPPANAETNRITAAAVNAVARSLNETLAGDLMLLITNGAGDEFHIVRPDMTHSRPRLQRMVARRGEHHRTVVQQLANMWDDYGRNGKTVHESIVRAFSVEPVTADFFHEYRRIFADAKDGIRGFDDERDLHLFAQTLFNRLMFIYFISRKGWLSFGGDTDYLNALWSDYGSGRTVDSNFYQDRLRLLFFAGLNNAKSEDLTEYPDARRLIGKVPFLNGGLFDESDVDARSDIHVPDAVILPILRDLFDRFNFTVTESTPYDTEVAVDPEMLGKVFEELVNERHQSGAYYTPRPVVSYMCREALKGFLSGAETGLSADAISRFVDAQNTDGISVPDARKISAALERVTVADPACGSGAYLLGMMQELVDLQTTLFNVGADAKSIYDLKLEIIRRNLYGADIDDFAVNIAMLRMWLSLAIEFESDAPEPLPNLDFKIACGDSLLAPDPDPAQQGSIFTNEIRESKLADLKFEYMRAREQSDKDKLRAEIAVAQAQIKDRLGDAASVEGAIDWHVEFAEVMGVGGFDIVIANPPYIQLQRDRGRLGQLYKDVGYSTFIRSGDIYQLFYERGCQMLKPSTGLLAYITSNSWLKAEYGKRSRSYFSEQHTPLALLELGKDVFESAIVDSSVVLVRTGRTRSAQQVFDAVDVERLDVDDFPPPKNRWGQVRLDGELPWSILSQTEHGIIDKMRRVGTPLKEWDIAINYGIKTGYNDAFIIDNQTKEALVAEDPRSAQILKPVLRGRDIRRFRAEWAGLWLIDTHNGFEDVPAIKIDEYPAIKHRLDSFYERLERRYDKGSTPYNLRNCAYHGDFTKEKLLWIELVDNGRFAYDSSGIFGEATTFLLTGERIKYLCAVLNSTLIRWYLSQVAPTSGMGTLRWKKVYVEKLPLPKPGEIEQLRFEQAVNKIIRFLGKDQSIYKEVERQIDQWVYELYGLTQKEISAIKEGTSSFS